jgi:uncharacterized protein (DUF433 family)
MEVRQQRPQPTPYEIGARIAAGESVATLLADHPELTTQDLREAVEAYLAVDTEPL